MSAIVNDRDVLLQKATTRDTEISANYAIVMLSSSNLFAVNGDGETSPPIITFKAQLINMQGVINWTVSGAAKVTAAGDGLSATLSYTDVLADTVSVTCSCTYRGITRSATAVIIRTTAGRGPASAVIYAYKRSAGALSSEDKPGTAIYEFATKKFSTNLTNGWSTTIPTGTAPLYVVAATAYGTASTDTVESTDWSDAVLLAQSGMAGLNVSTVFVYLRNSSVIPPARPSLNATYTFATGSMLNLNNSWSRTIPSANLGDKLWVTTATAASITATDEITPDEWAAPQLMAEKGSPGTNGDPGRNGYDGTRGTVDVAVQGYTAWPGTTAAATTAFMTTGYGAPISRDRLTLYGTGFSQTRYYDAGQWKTIGAFINGNMLVEGTVSADSVSTGNGVVGVYLTGNVPVTDNLGNSITNGGYFYQNSGTLYAMYAKNSFTGTGGGVVKVESFGTGISLQAVNNNSGTAARAISGQAAGGFGGSFSSFGSVSPALYAENLYGGHGARIRGGNSNTIASAAVIGTAFGQCFYSEVGTFGPFTGSHDAMLSKTSGAVPGDIMVDMDCLSRNGLNDTIFLASISTKSCQKNVIGVLTTILDATALPPPAAFIDNDATSLMVRAEMGENYPVAKPGWATARVNYSYASVNAIGEGQMNVCGENGNIEAGDLIVASNIPGKGMRQSDDIVRGYTVAKAREAVTFSSPNEVKQVACIYMCG